MAEQEHLWDQVARELADWLDTERVQLAAALRAGGRAPFAAKVSEKEKLEFYARQFFNPDGTRNTAGIQRTLERVGPEGFAKIYSALKAAGYPVDRAQPPAEGLPNPFE